MYRTTHVTQIKTLIMPTYIYMYFSPMDFGTYFFSPIHCLWLLYVGIRCSTFSCFVWPFYELVNNGANALPKIEIHDSLSCSLSFQKNPTCQHSFVYGVDIPPPDHHSDAMVWWLHPLQTFTCDGDSVWDVPVDWHCQTVSTGGWVSYSSILFIIIHVWWISDSVQYSNLTITFPSFKFQVTYAYSETSLKDSPHQWTLTCTCDIKNSYKVQIIVL